MEEHVENQEETTEQANTPFPPSTPPETGSADQVCPEEENKMGLAPIFPLLMTMSLPAMFSMVVQSLYNVVDSFFVAQYSQQALTAISLAFPIQVMMIGVAVGSGIGINSLISRSLGAKQKEYANRVANHSIFLGLMGGFIFAIFGLFFTKPFFQLFTNDAVILKMGIEYLSFLSVFSFGVFIQINFEKMFQSTGNMKYPMIIQLIGAITNIILDPIFIFGMFGLPKMGIFGAALATVIGQISAMCVGFYLIFHKTKELNMQIRGFRPDKDIIKKIYTVGFPSIIMQTIGSFVVIIMNNLLISFSDAAVTVMGIYFKLNSFVFMPVFGITHGAMPIFGYNFGAKNRNRIMACLKYSLLVTTVIVTLGMILFMVVPDQLLKIFNATPEIIQIGRPALIILSTSFLIIGVNIMLTALFQSIGHANKGLIMTLIRQVFVTLPLAYLFSQQMGVVGVWLAYPIAEIVAAIIGVCYLKSIYQKELKQLS